MIARRPFRCPVLDTVYPLLPHLYNFCRIEDPLKGDFD